ncbi:MAG: BMP family ABC transporter substrate-binding protein [Comamonas sp.]
MKRVLTPPIALATLLLAGSLQTAGAAESTPAVLFDSAGKHDRSFNQSAYEGAEAYSKATGKRYTEFSLTNESQREQALQRLAQRGGNPVVSIGYTGATALDKVAPQFPKTQFYIIDSTVDQPNVRSYVFRDHEGSFLVGALAAMKSATGKIGFVGGMDIPLIRRFACGYEQGAHYVNPKVVVLQNMTGTTPMAWNDPTKGGELARSQIERGADVIFAAAGGTGIGVYQAVKDAGKYAIGVDSNQNHLHPGTMLTSMIKRVDVAVQTAFTQSAGSTAVSGGVTTMGLKERGVDWALDADNRALVTPEMERKVNAIRQDIIDGKIKVTDSMATGKCD